MRTAQTQRETRLSGLPPDAHPRQTELAFPSDSASGLTKVTGRFRCHFAPRDFFLCALMLGALLF